MRNLCEGCLIYSEGLLAQGVVGCVIEVLEEWGGVGTKCYVEEQVFSLITLHA